MLLPLNITLRYRIVAYYILRDFLRFVSGGGANTENTPLFTVLVLNPRTVSQYSLSTFVALASAGLSAERLRRAQSPRPISFSITTPIARRPLLRNPTLNVINDSVDSV